MNDEAEEKERSEYKEEEMRHEEVTPEELNNLDCFFGKNTFCFILWTKTSGNFPSEMTLCLTYHEVQQIYLFPPHLQREVAAGSIDVTNKKRHTVYQIVHFL